LTLVEVVPAHYPELARLVWNGDPQRPIAAEDALTLYERNWRHVDKDALSDQEAALISALVETHGNGVMLVD